MERAGIERDEVFRLRTERTPGTLARVLAAIGDLGAHIGEIATIHIGQEYNLRDVTVIAPSDEVVEEINTALGQLAGVELVDRVDTVFARHEGGKLEIVPRTEVRSLQDMREVYTPGVARVSRAIAADPALADIYTWRARTVAVVSNGTRVLGLGNIGPAASLPVMEGKAMFYGMLVGLNAVPIVLDTEDPEEVIETVVRIAPGFGGIHLEDIATPGAYRIEEELDRRLDIPVMHDDQHGTAVVLMGAMLSAARVLGRGIDELTLGQVGLGAAGSAIARLALEFPFRSVRAFDPTEEAAGRLISQAPAGAPLEVGNTGDDFDRLVAECDVLVMTTGRPGLLPPERVREGQVIFALSNPIPEITVEDARRAGAALAADGSIVNNVLAYPGLFRGAMDARAPSISIAMKCAAAGALTELAPPGRLLPDPLDVAVHTLVTERVAATAAG